MCLSFICDFWLLNIILNSTELKCTQNITLYHFVHSIFSVPFCSIPLCPYTILSATILSSHHLIQVQLVLNGAWITCYDGEVPEWIMDMIHEEGDLNAIRARRGWKATMTK